MHIYDNNTHLHTDNFPLHVILTQLTMGGNRDAEMATPINGPAEPCSNARATPEPDVSAQATAIHSDRAFPL